MSVDFSSLYALLNNTKLQAKDIALYNVIKQLIEKTVLATGPTSVAVEAITSAFINATYITKTDEIAQLPQSWYLVAGSNVVLDSSTPNQLIINVTIPPTTDHVLMGDGATPPNPMTIGNQFMYIAYTP